MSVHVSIVIPVFNKADYLAACVESAIRQRSVRVEVICVDDASTDGSADLLDTLSRSNSNICVIKNDRNCGPGISRNLGLAVARGEYVRFVDADDLLPLHSTAVLYETALKEGTDLVRGSLVLVNGDQPNEVVKTIAVPMRNNTSFAKERLLWIPWWHTSYLISGSLIRDNGLRYPDLRSGEDPVFMANVLLKSSSISMIEDIVYLYRRYPKTTGSGLSTFEAVLSYCKHAEMVRKLYDGEKKEYWNQGYGPFLRESTQNLINRCNLDSTQRRQVEAEIKRVWNECNV